jgi:L-aminopeptidase/D-esterase-like protein
VVVCRHGATVGVDVRGSAPATRETDLCRPGGLVGEAHAIFLTGGSAFGLDATAGVMTYLREHGSGFPTGVMPVPIVPAAAIFDLAVGEPAWPDPDMAYAACRAATSETTAQGCVGAGIGATVGKARGLELATKSGVGTASTTVGPCTVAALMVVNAFGNVVDPNTGKILAGVRERSTGKYCDAVGVEGGEKLGRMNTTIGVVATDAVLVPTQISHLAAVGHDGLARTIRPAHTLFDGDALFGLATGQVALGWIDQVVALERAVADVVERAVVNAIHEAVPMGGLPAGG